MLALRKMTMLMLAAMLLAWPGTDACRSRDGAGSSASDRDGQTAVDIKYFNEKVRPFVLEHCQACHTGAKAKGDFKIDQLAADAASSERWLTVLKRLRAGEMPPKSQPRPPEGELLALMDWIDRSVAAADAARRVKEGRSVLRRLNRAEYHNTVRDLLGVTIDLHELLPRDESAHGFDNVGEALHTSSFLMERYLEAADRALSVAIANGPKPEMIKERYSLKDTHQLKTSTERVYRKLDDGTVVCFSSSPWNMVVLTPFYPPNRGTYRFRISASAVQCDAKPVTFRVDAGPMLMATKNHLVSYFDAPAGKPAVIEFTDYLEARSHISILPYGLERAQVVDKIGADKYKGPGLAVHWVEVEGPIHDAWPPASHCRLFGDLPQTPSPNDRNHLEVDSKNHDADAEHILREFTRRAFRRAVTDADVKPFLDLVKRKLADKYSFERAVRVGLTAVMVSPHFLFLREHSLSPKKGEEGRGRLDDFALASRLSYFLWSTIPDEELLTLAEKGRLGDAEVLRGQVERMLKDSKSAAFTENFIGQWLNLRDIDFTEPSQILYPEFDHMLNVSMVRETELFFTEVLKDDLSITNFVAADFSMLNGRLARHYGVPGVEGFAFKKMKLPKDSHRGGVLTMASVLKVTANGTTTSPVTRGAFVLERILGTPPPRPPAEVAALEPDIRGATTTREQLAKHRKVESCAGCHAKIDPPGFALESFDVIGGWRENYRTTGKGEPVTVDGRRMPYLKGPKVEPADVLADGRMFRDVDEFKELLLSDKDQLARALTERLVTYATGAAPSPADQPQIDAIVRRIRDRDYGLRTLVHEIVQSELFRRK